jgi:hypothetical protein
MSVTIWWGDAPRGCYSSSKPFKSQLEDRSTRSRALERSCVVISDHPRVQMCESVAITFTIIDRCCIKSSSLDSLFFFSLRQRVSSQHDYSSVCVSWKTVTVCCGMSKYRNYSWMAIKKNKANLLKCSSLDWCHAATRASGERFTCTARGLGLSQSWMVIDRLSLDGRAVGYNALVDRLCSSLTDVQLKSLADLMHWRERPSYHNNTYSTQTVYYEESTF